MVSLGMNLVPSLGFFALICFAYSGDPCPNKHELAPCTCSQVEVKRSFFEELDHTTTPLPTTLRLRGSVTRVKGTQELSKHSQRLTDKEEGVTDTHYLDTLSSLAAENRNTSYYTSVQCKTPKSLLILEESIGNGLRRKSVDELLVTNVPPQKEHTLVRLPRFWLKYVRVKKFKIKDSVLSGDFIHYDSPFEGQEQSLVSFSAINCFLYGSLTFDSSGSTNTKGLNNLPHLRVINLSKNHLVYLSSYAFRYPPANLTTINLSYNSIQEIELSVFNYAPKLKAVDLSHNLIQTIVRSFFSTSPRALEEINLSWNHIKVIPVDMFKNMPSLKVVNLSHNFLYSLPVRPWSAIWKQLKFVELRGNFLECNCDLLWLLDILSPSKANSTTTPAPTSLPGQTVLGSCDYTEPQLYTKTHQLVKLTREHLNCSP